MPLAKKVSAAIQAALMNTLGVPPENFYQLIFELPRAHFRHHALFRWHALLR
jgi:hypothetical protein